MIREVQIAFLQVSKAAIGLARLCLDPTTADSVVRLGGLDKLFPLAEVSSANQIASFQSLLLCCKSMTHFFEAISHACVVSTLCVGEELKSQTGGNLKLETIGRKLSCVGAGHMSATQTLSTTGSLSL